MPTWGEILRELQQTSLGNRPIDFDGVRRKYLLQLQQHTHRNTILYATKWLQPDVGISPEIVSVTDEDMEGLMESVHGMTGTSLDLIIHSPGGSAEAAEALVTYLRSKFTDIRAIVPHAAMSAATMMCCGADRILMGKHSFLGPIDPQFILQTPLGVRPVPAQAILDQFGKAKEECKDTANLAAWLPMLGQFGPGLLVQCENALALAKEVVKTWLREPYVSG
jgi:ClpP class serine protease